MSLYDNIKNLVARGEQIKLFDKSKEGVIKNTLEEMEELKIELENMLQVRDPKNDRDDEGKVLTNISHEIGDLVYNLTLLCQRLFNNTSIEDTLENCVSRGSKRIDFILENLNGVDVVSLYKQAKKAEVVKFYNNKSKNLLYPSLLLLL